MSDLATPLLIGATAVLSTGGAGLIAWSALDGRGRREFDERFERLVRGERPHPEGRLDLRSSLIEFGGSQAAARGIDDEVPMLLARAGVRGREPLAMFAAVRVLGPFAALGAVALPWLLSGRELGVWLLITCYAVFTLAYLAPKWLLRSRARAREQRLRGDVAVLTHLMRVLYDCGLSTEQALHVFGKDRQGVLPDASLEVGEVMRMVGAGSSLEQATREVSSEIAVPELTDLFAMIRQIDRYGGQVQEPLLRFASLLEDRERTRLQETIGKLSAKLTIVMVLFLLPALLTFVAGPGFVSVIRALGEMGG